MSAYFTCPQGHRWHVSLDDGTLDEAAACPLCGASAQRADPRPTIPARNTIAFDPPPPPIASPSPPYVPGYEIEGVLGRGGMGVVYKARAVRLNRPVALKVLLDRGHAGPQQLARFQIEAEALASLQHANVVQIFEVGEHEFRPYLALELVEGGSLADAIAEQRFRVGDWPAAARLVETLARAMHAVHQRGVVHRDLKPANVLLALVSPLAGSPPGPEANPQAGRSAAPLADVVPKITDFGLAKRLHQDDQATRTGAVMGTPHYMAPEQAQAGQVGPPADVYALGAILYELLTGEPPFEGGSALEVLDRVRNEDPLAPSRRRKDVPRDLETIALKCLEKDPPRRYSSAGELADDLRRYLNGEPIRARPVGMAERSLKWARREPAALALVMLSAAALGLLIAGATMYTLRVREERDRAARGYELALDALDGVLKEVAETEAYSRDVRNRRLGQLEKTRQVCGELLLMGKADLATRRQLARAVMHTADALKKLSRHKDALEESARAVALLEELVEEDPGTRRPLARAYNTRGEVLRVLDRPVEAREAYASARKLLLDLRAGSSDRTEDRRDLLRVYYNLAILSRESWELDAADDELREALRLAEGLEPEVRNNPDHRLHLARVHLNRATVLHARNKTDDARRAGDLAIRMLEELRRHDPNRPDYSNALAVALNNRGNALANLKEKEEARKDLARAMALLEPLVEVFPDEPEFSENLANAWNSRGYAVWEEDRQGARQAWERARDLQRRLCKVCPDVPSYRADLGRTLGNLGWLDLQQYRDEVGACAVLPLGVASRFVWRRELLGRARERLEEGMEHLRAAQKLNPASRRYQDDLGSHQINLDDVLALLRQPGR